MYALHNPYSLAFLKSNGVYSYDSMLLWIYCRFTVNGGDGTREYLQFKLFANAMEYIQREAPCVLCLALYFSSERTFTVMMLPAKGHLFFFLFIPASQLYDLVVDQSWLK